MRWTFILTKALQKEHGLEEFVSAVSVLDFQKEEFHSVAELFKECDVCAQSHYVDEPLRNF